MHIISGVEIPRKKVDPVNALLKADFPTEEKWQKTVIRMFRQMGSWEWYHTKNSMHSQAGFPDLCCIHTTLYRRVWIELKTETGAVTEAQAMWLMLLANSGDDVYILRPSDVDELTALLQRANDDAFSLRERGFVPPRVT